MGNPFFETKELGVGIWSIAGPSNDLMYLVLGQERAMLVDTGMGIGDLGRLVKSLTDKPLVVVNTHGHPDHAGGNANFEEVWLPSRDDAIRHEMATYNYRLNDLKAFHGEDSPVFRQLRAGLVKDRPYRARPIQVGQIFDLGGRRFEVLELSGHTPGSLCFLNAQEKIMFTGDSIIETPVWLYLKHSRPVQTYHAALLRVKAREKEFETLLPGHQPTPVGRQHLDDLIQCAEQALQHPGAGEFTRTPVGEGWMLKYGRVSIIYDPANVFESQAFQFAGRSGGDHAI